METYLSGLHWTNAAYIDDNEINSEMQYPIKECCLKKIFISLYCLRSNLKDIHTESVFALSLTGNVVISKARGQNEQHSFLFRLCGKGVLYPAIPHIYSSVGYCIVYSC